jgi:acetyl esterase/lipase
MFGVSRRLIATFGAAATILVLTTSAVAAADPQSMTSAHMNGSSTGAVVALGARSHLGSGDAGPARLQFHGGGLHLPATDTEAAPLHTGAQASGVGVTLATWIVVFVVGVLASLKYLARRSRL